MALKSNQVAPFSYILSFVDIPITMSCSHG